MWTFEYRAPHMKEWEESAFQGLVEFAADMAKEWLIANAINSVIVEVRLKAL